MTKSIALDLEDLVDFTNFSRQPHQLIPILQYCQSQKGYISREAVNQIAELSGRIGSACVWGGFLLHPIPF